MGKRVILAGQGESRFFGTPGWTSHGSFLVDRAVGHILTLHEKPARPGDDKKETDYFAFLISGMGVYYSIL
jgi:hypothetical protein